jgi:hypothetical protein
MADKALESSIIQTAVRDYQTGSQTTDGASEGGETFWYNENFTKWYGKYKSIAKLRIPINAFATWIVGQGWTAGSRDTVILNRIMGIGDDNFMEILWNMIVTKKINGRSYAQIVRNEDGTSIINIKPLDPSSIVTVVNEAGLTIRHEQISKVEGKSNKVIRPQDMLYFVNDRVADDTTGTSIVEAVEWNIEAQEEARRMFRRKVKNSGILGVLEIDSDDTGKFKTIDAAIKKGMEEGTLMKIPKGTIEARNWVSNLNTQEIIQWLNYLDDEFFMMIGIPKVILGGSSENEGDKKMSYVAFEQVYKKEINGLIDDIWNQLGIKIEFNFPASITQTLATNNEKNASQVGFQANDTLAGVGE